MSGFHPLSWKFLFSEHLLHLLHGREDIFVEAGVTAEEIGASAGDELIELGRHLMAVVINGIFDVVALPIYRGIAVDALLLMEEAVGHFYEIPVKHPVDS